MKKSLLLLVFVLMVTLMPTANAEWRHSGRDFSGLNEIYWQTDTVTAKNNLLYFQILFVNSSNRTKTIMDAVMHKNYLTFTRESEYDMQGNLRSQGPSNVRDLEVGRTFLLQACVEAIQYAKDKGLQFDAYPM
jgi:hypothetical protein